MSVRIRKFSASYSSTRFFVSKRVVSNFMAAQVLAAVLVILAGGRGVWGGLRPPHSLPLSNAPSPAAAPPLAEDRPRGFGKAPPERARPDAIDKVEGELEETIASLSKQVQEMYGNMVVGWLAAQCHFLVTSMCPPSTSSPSAPNRPTTLSCPPPPCLSHGDRMFGI